MGDFINIGLITDKQSIIDSSKKLLMNKEDFTFKRLHTPQSNDFSDWICLNSNEISIEKSLLCCLDSEVTYFVGDFSLGKIHITDAVFSIESSSEKEVCFIISIQNNFEGNIDCIETNVIEFLKTVKGYKSAFCDNEAHLGDFAYSIYVNYGDKVSFSLSDWKIDGLSKRDNTLLL